MEPSTPQIQNSVPQTSQEAVLVLQFPEQIKGIFRMYIIVFLSLTVITVLLSKSAHYTSPDNVAGLFIVIALLSFVTGIISVIRCIRYRQNLSLGQKIIGWTASILTLTIIIPILTCATISYVLFFLF